jgi:hypothetical protein
MDASARRSLVPRMTAERLLGELNRFLETALTEMRTAYIVSVVAHDRFLSSIDHKTCIVMNQVLSGWSRFSWLWLSR